MSHFYGDLTGSRGTATRCGTKASGINSHPRGWDLGVKVYGEHWDHAAGPAEDIFTVELTGGSGGHVQQQFARIERDHNKTGWRVRLTRPDGTSETLNYS